MTIAFSRPAGERAIRTGPAQPEPEADRAERNRHDGGDHDDEQVGFERRQRAEPS